MIHSYGFSQKEGRLISQAGDKLSATALKVKRELAKKQAA